MLLIFNFLFDISDGVKVHSIHLNLNGFSFVIGKCKNGRWVSIYT